jgi:hypothetical protein
MGQVATITISAVNHSVYALTANAVTDADGYFGARLGATAWTGATTLLKQQALVSAARMMDRRATWTGTQTVPGQALQWPRDNATKCGEEVADGTVPDDIALAEFELALALLNDAAIQNSAGTGSNIRVAKAGSAQVEFFVPTIGTSSATQFPQPVHELLRCYLDSSTARLAAGPVVTGTDPDCCNQRSTFDECGGGFGLNGGL